MAIGIAVFTSPAMAAQTGEIAGTVTDASGAPVAGVEVEARGDVLPQPRTTTTGPNGKYRFRLLPPGNYTVDFTFSDGSSQTRSALVLLEQTSSINVAAGGAAIEEIVTTGQAMMAEVGEGALKDSISAEMVNSVPTGTEYRDLLKLLPGVQYTEDAVLGPSAGGSASDNTFMFDGVDVTLPLFGNLASEPSTHDVAQISVVRGGARAIGFNRSGGLSMNTISKTGTDEFKAELEYKVENKDMRADFKRRDNPATFDDDRAWLNVNVGGPLIKDRLYFYTSFYRPEYDRTNGANAYGDVPDYNSTRDEIFGKLTWSPTDNITIDASMRTSEREVVNSGVGAFTQPSAADVSIGNQDILTLDGSWIISDRSSMSFRYTDWENETGANPTTFVGFQPVMGDSLNISNLASQGAFLVPVYETINEGDTAEQIAAKNARNALKQTYIDQYGYLDDGVLTGGGLVGSGGTINNQDFFRESWEISFDHLIYAGETTHDLHFGIQYMEVSELLLRQSNGWGTISVANALDSVTYDSDGDGVNDTTENYVYRAAVYQQGLGLPGGGETVSPPIDSVTEMYNIEINDTIEMGDWTFNIGFLISQDTLFGQGLRKNSSNVSGFELAIGERYEMIKMDWDDMIQPRLGANWDYADDASVYINYARSHPTASSLSRAASWDRRFGDRIMDVYFDANGDFITTEQQSGSGGKLFEAGIKPRSMDEILVGWTKDVSSDLSIRAQARYRKGDHFWEDVPNNIYLHANPPPQYAREEIIPGLAAMMDELGGGGETPDGISRAYVIDELDHAFTKYYELGFDADWNRDQWSLRGSYVWSHYYGNFDNDNVSGDNDRNLFIGSSSFGDGAGRMQWNNKKGDLRGDRRHMLKLYGSYEFNFDGVLGAYLVWQSGQPWTPWDNLPWADEIALYRITNSGLGNSTSEFLRFAEPAGSRTTPSHWQLDIKYTHNFQFGDQHSVQLVADIFNLFDNQTGYNYNPYTTSSTSFEPRSWFKPRLIRLSARYRFN
jgi:hypothetical protein